MTKILECATLISQMKACYGLDEFSVEYIPSSKIAKVVTDRYEYWSLFSGKKVENHERKIYSPLVKWRKDGRLCAVMLEVKVQVEETHGMFSSSLVHVQDTFTMMEDLHKHIQKFLNDAEQ